MKENPNTERKLQLLLSWRQRINRFTWGGLNHRHCSEYFHGSCFSICFRKTKMVCNNCKLWTNFNDYKSSFCYIVIITWTNKVWSYREQYCTAALKNSQVRSVWWLKQFHYEPTSRIRENQNKVNETFSGMECTSALIFKWYQLIKRHHLITPFTDNSNKVLI